MRTKYKAWTVPYLEEHKEVTISVNELVNFPYPYYLEIGSGKGLFLANMALENPDKQFIGVERNVTCAGISAKKLVEQQITNAKLLFNNADELLMNLKDDSIDGLFLNFSDPWPKKRHAKRRLTYIKYLDEYYRVLKKGSHLYFKTDNVGLFDFTLEEVESSKFTVISSTRDYDGKSNFDAQTEYELKNRAEGHNIYRLILTKEER